MKYLTFYTALLLCSFSLSAYQQVLQEPLIDENTINKWGYVTLTDNNTYDYHKINSLEDELSLQYQSIKSIQTVTGYKNTYYYYSLSKECFENKFRAYLRRLSFGFLDDKDFRRGEVMGSCIYIIDTSAKLGTYKERSRVFNLFKTYLNDKKNRYPVD